MAESTMTSELALSEGGEADSAAIGFRIAAPLDGDVYHVPPGVPTTYATIPLIAAGEEGAVRWYVNGRPHEGSRWRLARGAHVIRAEAGGVIREVRIRVE